MPDQPPILSVPPIAPAKLDKESLTILDALTSKSSSSDISPTVITEKMQFRDAVLHARSALGKTVDELMKAMSMRSKSEFYKYLNGNEWPEIGFAELCEELQFPFRTKTEARSHYVLGDAKSNHRSSGQRGTDTFAGVIARLDEAGRDSPSRKSRQVDPLILKMIATMRKTHYWVGTTQSIPFAPFMDRYPLVPEAMYSAMDSGALFGFVVPSEKWSNHLVEYYGLQICATHQELLRGFQKFSWGYVEWLRSRGVEDPERVAARRTQLFKWGEFPVTPEGSTVTLLGEARANGNYYRRVLLRVPTDYGQGSMLAPQNQTRELNLHNFIVAVLRNALATAKNAETDQDLNTFIKSLLLRMNGRQ